MQRPACDPGFADVKLVANLTMQLAYRNKDKLQAGMIIGGWDEKEGAQVYGRAQSLLHFSPQRQHFLWGRLVVSFTKSAQTESKSGGV